MSNILNVSPSPHQQSAETTRKLMYGVVIALLPALATSIWFFGMGAIIVTLVSVFACVATEYIIQKFILKTKPSISDGSAVVTGLLLAFNVPSNLPVYIIIIGAIVSIGVAKMTFGGLGNNPFNPALVGRVFMLISFPVQMTSWPLPQGFNTGLRRCGDRCHSPGHHERGYQERRNGFRADGEGPDASAALLRVHGRING